MAAVLRARDTQLDRIVALKILPPEMAQDPENVRRFHQEARAAAKLDHENIARVFFCGEDQNLHFIAFEYVEGENLRVIVERRGRLPVDESVRYILQIAAGLEHAHGRGVVHRDVKPSNIIVTPTGRAKLVDMGLARNLERVDDHQLTQSGVTLGTFDYISPEQALEPRDADCRSDLYSLGCTFYHMVTGQPPTPEGTAAKKLHHHQHVAPIDPRLLNPAVPDEVALILGKMMAKDPSDRYQRPVELVQHLMHVAQKLGVSGDVPEGGFLVEAPLPTEPRLSTGWMIGIGMSILAVVMLILSLAPPPTEPVKPAVLPKNLQSQGNPPVVAPKPILPPDRPKNDFALQMETKNTVKATGVVNLGDGLIVRGEGQRKIVIESEDENEIATLRYEHSFKDQPELAAGILFDDCEVVFRSVRIEVKSATPKTPVAAIGIRGKGSLRFEKCIFAPEVQNRSLLHYSRIPVACVAAEALGETQPRITFEQCAFLPGQVAVASQGTSEIAFVDCSFRPQHAFVHLRGTGESTIRMENCSGFVVNGPALRLDEEAACKLTLKNNIFSRPENADLQSSDGAHLIRQVDSSTPHVVLESTRNLFHNLNALWVMRAESKATDRLIVGLEEFRREVQQARGSDVGSVVTTISPWLSKDPLKEDKDAAFRIQPKMPEVRTADLKRTLGIRSGPYGLMPSLPELAEPLPEYLAELLPNEKLVAPDEASSTSGKVFDSLAKAMFLANPEDVILLKPGKNNAEFPVETIENKKLRLTIRPWKDSKPVLVMARSLRPKKDAALFLIPDEASLSFEGVEFRLEPDQDGYTGMSVAQLQGNGSASFSKCVFTLQQRKDKNARTIPLAVVAFSEPDNAMMMNTPSVANPPRLSFRNCFLRGEGDGVVLRQSMPIDLRVDDSLAVLSGSFLSIQGVAKESPNAGDVKIECSQSAFFHGDAWIAAKGDRTAKGFHAMKGRSIRNCWFMPLSTETPLVRLEASESLDDLNLRSMFDWTAGRNVYGSYDRMLEQKSEGDLFRFRMSLARWKEMFHRDGDAVSLSKAFPTLPRPLSTALPDDAKAKLEAIEDIGDAGPAFDLLPRPAIAEKGEE
ncbi:MAG: serine/threonine-protein kinase [Gemmataceae bacterium]